jgi:hypothetical protein
VFVFPGPRPFFWLPVDGHRHAITARDRDVPVGSLISALCGVSPARQPVAEVEWFWPTCMTCWKKAAELIDP